MITYSELAAASVAPQVPQISYGSAALQHGELRLPAGDAKVPLVVLIHGGCWRAQYTLDHTRGAALALVKEGYAVWSPEYHRIGDAGGGWPGTFDDIAMAVDHVRALAQQHPRIDTSRVILMGHSAGGQLALWAGSRRAGEPRSGSPLKVAGVVSLAGITDMEQFATGPGSCNAAVHELMGGSAENHGSRYAAVDPVRRTPIGVRVRLVHGELDPIVPLAQSRTFVEKENAAGGNAELEVVPGLGHFDVVSPQGDAWPAVVRAVRAIANP